jgi:hypothetical protein
VNQLPQSNAELEEHLREQLEFLQSSADAFDSGRLSEAKRMATAVRTLVHDTKRSKSLLTQLKKKDVPFIDSAGDFSPSNLMSQALLLSIQIGSRGGGYVASLDRAVGDEPRLIPFDKWWHKIVFANMGEQSL